jgi:hypothetical protein
VRLRLGLLKDGRINPAIHIGQQRKHLIPNCLRVFGGVKHAIEVKAPPPEVAPQREQRIAYLAMTGRDCTEE